MSARFFITVFLLLGLNSAEASSNEDSIAMSQRMFHRMGLSMGIAGEPFPSLLGANLGYNINDWFRACLGYGGASLDRISISTASTQAVLLLSKRSLSPYLGLGVAYSQFSSRFESGLIERIQGSGTYTYSAIGMEWQTRAGLNLGIGYRFFLPWGKGLPGAQVGWYF